MPDKNSRTGEWVVNFGLDQVGAKCFADVSTRHVGEPFAIVLDGKVISAPVIREPIIGGQGQISGNFSAESANDLAVLLRAGALPAPLNVVEERSVGPSLGADSINAGLKAVAAGFIFVVAFVITLYGRFGVFAAVALVANLALTLAGLSLLGATLTLPGIAGLLLALGMAVDANILVNERVREEARRSGGVVTALEAGFRRAYRTIVDANATTLIKMLILFVFGAGAIRGFALTISMGIILSVHRARSGSAADLILASERAAQSAADRHTLAPTPRGYGNPVYEGSIFGPHCVSAFEPGVHWASVLPRT